MTGAKTRKVAAVVAMSGFLVLAAGSHARAQAVAYVPGIGIIPSGQTLTVTPVVSADRRYVRLTVNPFFNALNGFQTFNVYGAVGGGGGAVVGGGGGNGIVGGGAGALAGMNGVIGPGGMGGQALVVDEYGNPIGSFGLRSSSAGTRANAAADPDAEPLAGVYFAPPQGLIKGDPFSLDSLDQNKNNANPAFPLAAGDQQANPGFPIVEDAFVEDGGVPITRGKARATRSNRTTSSKARSTPARSRSASRVKAKKAPKTRSQSTGVESK